MEEARAAESPKTDVVAGQDATLTADEKLWGMLAHLAALSMFIIPFGGIIGPLVVWLVKKETMPFVADQGRESLNFQITVFIACLALMVVLVIITFILPILAMLLYIVLLLLFLGILVLVVMAGLAANKGVKYRYPFALRLIK